MTVSLFTFVGLFSRLLDVTAHLVDKGAEHAKAAGQPEEVILDWRLVDDMAPLRFQLMIVCNSAVSGRRGLQGWLFLNRLQTA